MIKFERIRWKNLLSTGDKWTTVQLDKNPQTLIVGSNGAGKSTLLDALTFVLFDKPFRKINKGRMVNTVNGRGLLIEINFKIGETDYMIRRGYKPNKFEIYRNKELIDQDGSNSDYQDYLERNILKMNYKSFTQVVILGSSTFVPFMELSAADRRAIVEDLLDIEIFSTMNVLAKAKLKTISHDVLELENKSQVLKEKIKVHKDHYDTLRQELEEKTDENDQEIARIEDENAGFESTIENIQAKIDEIVEKLSGSDKIVDIKNKISGIIQENKTLMRTHQKTLEFFTDNDTCPTCTQDIDAVFKNTIVKDNNKAVSKHQKVIEEHEEKLETVVEKLDKIGRAESRIRDMEVEISEIKSQISANDRVIQRLEKESEKTADSTKAKEVAEKVREMAGEYKGLNQIVKEKQSQKDEYETVVNLLKDSGIKTQVIRQYLPVMNAYINEYMEKMNFPAAFEIDEEFNENIRSQHRDDFNYANFSEGEKQRINLSLLLTWRKIAQMRNSAATNLLVLDEVFDSSLDVEGTEGFLNILQEFGEETNVFVISHKGDSLFERFNHVLEFYKVGNFSHMKEKMD